MARLLAEESDPKSKRAKRDVYLMLSFSEEDKVGTIQPHNDALVITLRIGGYDVKTLMVDNSSGAEIMYLDLYKGLNLRPEDLTVYDSLLMSFEGKMVTLRREISLPVQAGTTMVGVNSIMVDVYSPYTAIVARPWLHTLGVVSSTLHQKVKYPSGGRVKEILGC